MIHLSKYDRVTADLEFRGGSSRGTTFHCKACNKPAFKVKGVLDAVGEERTAFLQGVKARHAEHVKVCGPDPATDSTLASTPVKDETPKCTHALDRQCEPLPGTLPGRCSAWACAPAQAPSAVRPCGTLYNCCSTS